MNQSERNSILLLNEIITQCEKSVKQITNKVHKKDTNFIQDKAILNLYIDQIETSRSILFLLQKNQLFGVDTLIRLCLEEFIYLNAVMQDIETALMYTIYCDIENGKSIYNLDAYKEYDFEVVSYKYNVDGLDFSMSRETLDKLIEFYNSKFPKKSRIRKWYNQDGKTPGIDKLIKKLKLNPVLMAEYARLSIETHAVIRNYQVDLILKKHHYYRYHSIPEIDNSSHLCAQILIETHNLINRNYDLSVIVGVSKEGNSL